MYIRIEKGASAPISRQIADQVRAQCLSGVLKEGESLPSVRQLARDLAVNINTILRVYERLAAEGLIEMRHGEGTFVLPTRATANSDGDLKDEQAQFAREFESLIRRGLLLGVSTAELRKLCGTALASAKEQLSDKTRE